MGLVSVLAVLQASDPTAVFDLPGHVRGPIAFTVILLIGASLLWRNEELVERTFASSIDRPLSSLGYGIAAHLTIGFFGLYVTNQLAQLTVFGRSIGGVGLWAGLGAFAIVASLGFTVVGSAVVELGWGGHRWHGLLLGALAAGVAGTIEPVLGLIIWVVVVSIGIGGPVREWFHAVEDVESVP